MRANKDRRRPMVEAQKAAKKTEGSDPRGSPTGRPVTPRSRLWRRILLVVPLFILVSLAAATQHPYVRSEVQRRVSEAVRTQMGLDAEVGSVSFTLPFGITADYIRLDHPVHGMFARADELEIRPSVWALARGELVIERILIEGAEVRLKVVDQRLVNMPTFAQAAVDPNKPKPKNERIPLEELVIRRARLTVDGRPGFNASLHGMNAVVRVIDGTRLRVQLSVGEGELHHAQGDERVDSVLVTASFAPERIDIDTLRIDSSLLQLAISKAFVSLPFEHGRYAGRVKLATDLGRLARLPHGLELPPVQGAVRLDMKVDGSGDRYHARGTFHGDNPRVKQFGFGVLDLNIDATNDEVRLLPGSQGKVPKDGGLIYLDGRIGLSPTLPVQLRADIKHLEMHKLMAMLGVTDDCVVNWHLKGGFSIAGTAVPLNISGPIAVEHLAFKALTSAWHDPKAKEVIGTPPGRVNGRVVIRPDALRFENVHAHLPHSDMQVLVHVGFTDQINVTATSEHLDLRDATGLMGMPLTGAGPFSLELAGTYSNPTLTGSLDFADFSLDGFRVGHMRTKAALEKGGVAVRFLDTKVDKNESRYAIDDLFLDFSEQFSVDARARLERLSLADFYHTFALENDPEFKPYQGHVRGEATVRYTRGFAADDPDGTLRIDTRLSMPDASIYGQKFTDGTLEGSWLWKRIKQGTRGAHLELAELSLHRGQGSVSARGTLDYGGQLNMTLFGEELLLRELDAVRGNKLDIDGELDFVGTARGTLWVPEIALDVDLANASLGDRALDDAAFSFRVTQRDDPYVRAALSLPDDAEDSCVRGRKALAQATWLSDDDLTDDVRVPPRGVLVCGAGFGKRLDFDLALGIAPGLPAAGRMAFRNIPMAWAFARAARATAPVRGSLSGNLDVTGGELERPDSLTGRAHVDKVSFGQDKTWLESDGPIEVALTGQGVRVERARFVGAGSALELSGGASFENGLATHLSGRFDMAALSGVVPGIARSTGMLALDVNITGKVQAPSIYGRAKLANGSLLLRAYDHALEDVQASVSFSEREVLLEELSAQVLAGKVRLHGSAMLKGQALDHYELFINARDIDYSPMEGVELAFSADTKLEASPNMRVPELTGTVRLSRARYTRPFSLGISERITGLSQAKRVSHDTYEPEKDRVAFDLRVTEESPIRVANNLLNAELAIEDSERPFRIVGTDQRMGVLGALELTRGTLTFRNSRFIIEDGTVDFIDEHRIRPRLDVHARTEFRRTADATGSRWWISLHAMGESDNLKLEFSSEPALAQEDIALLLTVGLTRSEAQRLGTTELTQGAALEALATVTGVDREVKKALPVIDDFAVTSAYSVRSNRTEPQVVVGKRLTDKIRATATTGLTADSNFKTGVEWRFDNQTSIEAGYDNVQTTTASQFGNVGVDLRWRLEFD
jgi:translocation and assembly module TamB